MTKRSSTEASTPQSPLVSLPPHAALDERFEVLGELGRGGMGTVYDAVDRTSGERLAVKTLQHFDAESLYRFKHEFRALADLSHPNLVALYELYSSDEGWFFTMERVDGVGLLPWVLGGETPSGGTTSRRRGARRRAQESAEDVASDEVTRPVPHRSGWSSIAVDSWAPPSSTAQPASSEPAPAVADLGRLREAFSQLARALITLHDAGRVHRDVKPSNVMVAEGGRVVVLDFGIIAELGSSRIDDTSIAGTPGYMAPEQALEGTPPSPASDWYAFGVVLYEALAGRRPFLGTTTQVLAAKLAVTPPSLRDLAPEAPADLAALCGELLVIEPTRRPSGPDVLRRLSGGQTASLRESDEDAQPPSLRLVGRDEDLAVLEAARARACARRCEGVLLHGPSGRGKTALVHAFLTRAERREGTLVLRGRCYERESVPYKGLDSLVDALCRVLLAEPSASLARLLPDDVEALAAAFPVLRRVPAIAARCAQRAPVAEKLKERAMHALFHLVGGLAADREVILSIDDLQWGDSDSATILLELLASPLRNVFFVGTFRTEHRTKSPFLETLLRAAADGSARLREHALAPVTRAALRELAFGLLRGSACAAELAKRIAAESAGSPYLATELARHAASTRSTTIERTSLHTIIRDRLATLSHDARRLLEVVAVAGAPVRRSVALRVAEAPSVARRTLAQLERAGFLRSAEDGDDTHLEPMHTAVSEALLENVTSERQRILHLALARTLAERRDDADVHALARHYHQAWPLAESRLVIDACELAAQSAAATFAFELAFTHLQRARDVAIGSWAKPAPGFEHRLGEAAARSGHVAVAVQSLRCALETCEAPVERAQIRLELSKLLLAQLDTRNAARQAAEGLRELGMAESPGALATLVVCIVLLALHALRALLGTARAALGSATRDEQRARSALLTQSATTSWFRIDRRGQVVTLLRLVPLALRLGEPRALAYAFTVAAVVAAAGGLARISRSLMGRAHRALRGANDAPAEARIVQYQAHVYNFLGDPCASVREMQTCLETGGHMLENLDYLTAVADAAGNLALRGQANEGLRWVGLGVTRATIDGPESRLAQGHTYRCYAGPLLALVGRDAEARRVLDEFGETLGGMDDDRWRRGQWLAHRAMLYAELGGSRAAFEETVSEFHTLGLSPRAMPLQLRHFYVAQAMVRLAELDGSKESDLRWRTARAQLARAAGAHPTHRAHLRALDAAYHAWRAEPDAAREALDEAEELARAHDNALVMWDVSRLRALEHVRIGDALGARLANEAADSVAAAQGWTLRRARLLAAVKADRTDPRWPYGGSPLDPLEPEGFCL